MSEHESCVGASDDWYTPIHIFEALGVEFDLDPCSPGLDHWVPAKRVISLPECGLSASWDGIVWMNPPFGGRNGQVPWLEKFIKHGSGIALVAARTSSGWFHDHIPGADAILFPRGKTKFVRPDGSIGGSPGTGVVLISMGEVCCEALRNSGLGIYLRIKP